MRSFFAHICLCAGLFACAQTKTVSQTTGAAAVVNDSNFSFVRSIPGKYSIMEVDALGNLYLLNQSGQLKKIYPNGDSAAVFNDVKKYGTLQLIDVSNPLRPLLYYPTFSTVVMLDRFLSLRNSINFRSQHFFSVKLVTTSYDNLLWIFDEQDFKLKKIDLDGKLLLETTDWRMIFGEVPFPQQIIDYEGYVYVYDIKMGFFVFDYYGSNKNFLPFTGWQHINISGKKLYGFLNDKLNTYDLQLLTFKSYQLPAGFGRYNDIKAVNGHLYLLKEQGIEMYSIQ